MNIRMPEPIDGDFLKVQDEYLCAERDKDGVVDENLLPHRPFSKRRPVKAFLQ